MNVHLTCSWHAISPSPAHILHTAFTSTSFPFRIAADLKTPLCFKQSTNNATNSDCQLEIQLTRQTLSLRLSQRTLYHTYNGHYLSRDDHVTCQCCATGNTDKQAIPSTPYSCLSFRTKSQQMCDLRHSQHLHVHLLKAPAPSAQQENTPRSQEGTLQHWQCHDVTSLTSLAAAPKYTFTVQFSPTRYTYHLLGNVATEVRVHCVCIQVCAVQHKWAQRNQPRHE